MRPTALARIACLLCLGLQPAARAEDPPQVLFKDLFVAVQGAQLFADGKAFPDAVPNGAPADILRQYHAERPASPAALRDFVEAHFTLPSEIAGAPSPPGQVSITEHIDGLWGCTDPQLRHRAGLFLFVGHAAAVRGSGRPLPRNVLLGFLLHHAGTRRKRAPGAAGEHGSGLRLFDRYLWTCPEWRTHLLSQPFATALLLCNGRFDFAQRSGGRVRRLPAAAAARICFLDGRLAESRTPGNRTVAWSRCRTEPFSNRFWDDRDTPRDESYREDTELARESKRPAQQLFRDIRAAAESGWDFGSRWFADGASRATMDTTEIVPVDLNSLLFGLENAIRAGCARSGDRRCASEFAERAAVRRPEP